MSCKNDCASLPSLIKAEPDIAGIGILLSFTLAAALTVVITSFRWYIDLIESAERKKRWARNTQQLILALSDQQLATGLALSVATGWRTCQITSYHYRTVVLLTFVSISVHSLAIRTLAPFVAIPRSCAMIVHAALLIIGCVRAIYGGVGSVNGSRRADVRWPISCPTSLNLQSRKFNSQELGVGDSNRNLLTVFLTLFVAMIIGNLMYTWRRLRKYDERSDSIIDKAKAGFTSFLFNFAVAIAGIIFSITSVFKLRAQVRPYLEGNEDEWSFGQISAIWLLVILLFLVLESIFNTSKESPSDR